ncbi:hypothetical protein [Parasitella parasitica]|uniref:Reverse transcriptase zinc-binding domain-containing protein n=1 Tax=Parasitella parasitica TaxID=35722 RepID=A0A0B7N5L6_9FUNG|nr:hypothetical protein [Parasitella parasitica]
MLFFCSRSQGLTKKRVGTLDMMYGAMELLTKFFEKPQINTTTAMALPVQVAIYVPPSSRSVIPLKVKQMQVLDVFQYDTRLNFVHWKDTHDPSLRSWNRAPAAVCRGLASGKLQFQPYFLPVCGSSPPGNLEISFVPVIKTFALPDGQSLTNVKASSKTFRQPVLSSVLPPATVSHVSAAHWKHFWSLALTSVQRNVGYRLIVGCIPNRQFLHFINPQVFDSPLCPVCQSAPYISHHLLFHCPTKEKIWQEVIFEFLWPTTSINDIKEALLSLDFSNIWYCQLAGITPYRIVLISLSQIWLAHVIFIFDKTSIHHTAIMATIRSNICQTTIEEDKCHSLQ